jgi:hypothetical protein
MAKMDDSILLHIALADSLLQRSIMKFMIKNLWLLRRNIQIKRPSRKLDYQRLGPFKIIMRVNPVSFHLEHPPTMHIYLVFHISLLKPYKKSQIPPPPPLIEIDHDVEYEVKEILDSRL